MRKQQQRHLLEIIATLKEANSEMKHQFLQGNLSSVLMLLAESQNVIIEMGEFIESLVDGETETVALLENYHEALYHIAEEIETTEISFVKLLEKQLIKIERCVKKELKPDKVEIAFLSYNASMSDSIMSIFLAAKADPNCDAYWIPIPFFQLEPDGSLGEQHFEALGAYPGIECTDWRLYDIKARHPDIIFTFNGYDEYNLVTRVHPDFFCKRLQALTDCLVYVPYFVVDKGASPDLYRQFVNLPGTMYANKVILQDEKVRNTYINEFTKAWGTRYGRAEEKFIALGSPKYDMAIHANRADYDVPLEWRKVIGEKRVVFYNTTIAGVLKHSEHYLTKMISVFEFFRERNDVVLWWRPHPLLNQTFSAMRPVLYNKYKKIVEQFKHGGWGIYDDTSDLHRAIAWSDAYYGDGSSVTELFKVTGKAVYFQGIDSTGNKQLEMLGSFGFYVTNIFEACGELYAVTLNEYLFKLVGNSFKYEREVATSPNLPRNRNFFNQIVTNDKVTFIPYNDNQVVVYDIKTQENDMWPLELKEEYLAPINNVSRNFIDGIRYKNKMFFVPCGYRNIVALHLDTKETEHCLDLRKLFPIEKIESLGYDWTWLNENTILLASLHTNEVLEFNLDTYKHRVHMIGRKNQSFRNIFKYGDNFFLIGRRQPFMLKWNYETGQVVIYDKLPKDFKVRKKQGWIFYTNKIKPYKNKVILLGGFTNMVLEFDLDNCEFRKLDAFDEILNRKLLDEINNIHSFSTCNYMVDNFLYFVHKNEVLYRYDFERQEIEKVCPMVSSFTDDDIEALNDRFIDNMLKNKNSQVSGEFDKLQDGQAGKRIYDYVRKKVLR